MQHKPSIIVTSISSPNKALTEIANGAIQNDYNFILVGDQKTPSDFTLKGCLFFSFESQKDSSYKFAALCPENHYSRKNLGYLFAIDQGSRFILETDDDNLPRPEFWRENSRYQKIRASYDNGWVNVYEFFSKQAIWPRGFPLEYIKESGTLLNELPLLDVNCPIQQGLADNDPDVDAVYRLLMSNPEPFNKGIKVALGKGSWCPFNSQNTIWYPETFPLLYLPSYCSFRMTDIWRSFVTQRIAWENDWCVMFHDATVYQERNLHNLISDFESEIPGYLNNTKIARELGKLRLQPGADKIGSNLIKCYKVLIDMTIVGEEEIELLQAWLTDLEMINSAT